MGGAILNGADIIDQALLQGAAFDKVINLRFRQVDESGTKERFFSLRSDYELKLDTKGSVTTYRYVKCQQKPSIRVQYLQVTGQVDILIKIYVTNFHFFFNDKSSSGAFSANKSPIKNIEIQLGYFNQFAHFDDDKYLGNDDGKKLNEFLELGGHNGVVQTINAEVLGVYPVKLPPDGVTMFDCKVGLVDGAFHSQQSVADTPMQFDKGTKLSFFLFQSITKRFLRNSVSYSQLEFDSGDNGALTGPMTDACARKFGVLLYLSDKAEAIEFDRFVPALPPLESVEATIEHLKANYFPSLRFKRLYTGDFIVYHTAESIDNIIKSAFYKDIAYESVKIPAIKSISYGGTRTITCPYFGLFHPFQQLEFFARYNLANLVGYFYSPEAGKDTFYSIQLNVDFSTTGPENTMEITSVDSGSDAKSGGA